MRAPEEHIKRHTEQDRLDEHDRARAPWPSPQRRDSHKRDKTEDDGKEHRRAQRHVMACFRARFNAAIANAFNLGVDQHDDVAEHRQALQQHDDRPEPQHARNASVVQ